MATANVTIELSPADRDLIQRLIDALQSVPQPVFLDGKPLIEITPIDDQYTGPSDSPAESFPVVTGRPNVEVETEMTTATAEDVAPRHYTVPEVGRAGAELHDKGLLEPDFFATMMKGKSLSDLSQEELDNIAKIFIAKGAVI